MPSRREVAIAGAAALTLPVAAARSPSARFIDELRSIERSIGGDARLGLKLIDPVSRIDLSYRAGERFPMCSTFKLLLVGMILRRVDRGMEQLDRIIAIPARTLPNSPVTLAHAGGKLPVRDLCGAAMTVSDNSAANLLLATVGGPNGLTRFLRSIGDPATRLDRFETALNEGQPGDPRDTTTPAAILSTVRRLTFSPVLSPASRQLLKFWMANNRTGDEKLRKRLPPDWSIGDKTGAGGHNSNNDIALIWPRGRTPDQPMFVAAFVTGGPGDDTLARNPIHARIGELIIELTGKL